MLQTIEQFLRRTNRLHCQKHFHCSPGSTSQARCQQRQESGQLTGRVMFLDAVLIMLAIVYPVAFTFGSISIFLGVIVAIVHIAPNFSFAVIAGTFRRILTTMLLTRCGSPSVSPCTCSCPSSPRPLVSCSLTSRATPPRRSGLWTSIAARLPSLSSSCWSCRIWGLSGVVWHGLGTVTLRIAVVFSRHKLEK